MRRFILLWGPVFLFAIFIFVISSLSSTEGADPFPHFDKVAHMFVYGVLALLIFRSLTLTLRTSNFMLVALLTIIVAIAYGMSDEFHQSFVPTRNPDIKDIAADGIGALIAMT
ncbi:MAG: VanZ family protein, partial [Nitrospirota bacterium]